MSVALLYSALSGFALPTQRALLMLTIWLIARWWRRHWSLWQIWWLSLVILLLHDGWALFSAGLAFYRGGSAGMRQPAVATSLFVASAMPDDTGPVAAAAIAVCRGGAALHLINLLAIPLFGLVLIPVSLLAGLLVPVWPAGAAGWWLCDRLLGYLMATLAWLSAHGDGWLWLSAATALTLNLLGLALLAWWFPGPQSQWLHPGRIAVTGAATTAELELLLIDVGQGLSVLVRQGERALLYDTGDAFPSGYNLADAAILPLLRAEGIRRLDYLIVSHDDRDHASNWQRIDAEYPVRQLISSAPLSGEYPALSGRSLLALGGAATAVFGAVQGDGGTR